MSSILVINAAGRETRVALVENGHIAEFYLERKKDKGVVGNIYKGRVVRVLPGMQAAFVDIGLEKAAFLYVSDVVYDPDFARAQFELTEGEHDDQPEVPEVVEGEFADTAKSVPESALQGAEVPPLEARVDGAEVPALEAPPPPEHHAEQRATEELAAAVEGTHPEVAAQLDGTSEPAALSTQPEAPPLEVSPTEDLTAEPATPLANAPEPALESSAPREGDNPAEQAHRVEGEADAALSTEAAAPDDELSRPDGTVSQVHPPGPTTPGPETSGERRAPREQRERTREKPRRREGREPEKQRNGKENHREEEKPKPRGKMSKIEDLLKVGQEVVVQISKDPIGTKGARLTSHISIPGRHLVFMPTVDHVGISRRIGNEKERRRLREIVDRLRPPGTGFIVRTVAENVPQEKLESDIRFLIEIWNQVVRRNEKRGGPGLMHPDLDLILRATRDLFAQDVEKLVVDDRDEYERILGFVTAQDPALKNRIVLHETEEPVFDAYGIEQEIQRAVQRKVWLKSGGYLIIDQAEALTAIDVNSGRYVGKKSLEETITKINTEAAKEIVYQLRLRNIGGIIICDFIDMEKSQNRDKVFKTLQEALGRDKAKTNVLRISELGLVEMTRKRVRESIGRILHEDCNYCDGQGFVKTSTTITYEIFREIRREAPNFQDATLVINCNSEVAKLLQGDERQELRHLMDRFNKSIQVKAQTNYHREQYDIYGRSAQGTDHKVASSSSPRRLEGDAPPPPERRPEGRERGERDRGDRPHGGRDRNDRGERGRGDSGDRPGRREPKERRPDDRGRHLPAATAASEVPSSAPAPSSGEPLPSRDKEPGSP